MTLAYEYFMKIIAHENKNALQKSTNRLMYLMSGQPQNAA